MGWASKCQKPTRPPAHSSTRLPLLSALLAKVERNGQPHPETGSKVVLTIAHLDHDVTNNAPGNLRAWCQRCHLTYDAPHHVETRRRKLE